MGRKIPGKKHRGVKDPDKQRAQRWAELKTKINEPPRDTNEQAVPKSLQRVMKLKGDVKSGRIATKKRKKTAKLKDKLIKIGGEHPALHPKAKPEKAVPVFHQRPNENPYSFLNRVNRETQNFINETVFEKKYGVQVKRDPATGKIEGIERAPKDEVDELMKLQLKHKNTKKKRKTPAEPKLTKVQKRKRKLEERKARRLEEDIDEFKEFKEEIKFGEVVHAPPELTVRPAKAEKSTRPAKKDLLLNSLLNPQNKPPKAEKTIDKSGKRKNLPPAERRILEKQQSEAIAAYKQLKAKKLLN